jgi:hypothetical protein
MALQLGDTAPDFDADTTEGRIRFHEWLGGSWGVLFSHPKDFTPVCTTELGYMARLKPEFDKRNTKIIGLSVDPVENHKRWANDHGASRKPPETRGVNSGDLWSPAEANVPQATAVYTTWTGANRTVGDPSRIGGLTSCCDKEGAPRPIVNSVKQSAQVLSYMEHSLDPSCCFSPSPAGSPSFEAKKRSRLIAQSTRQSDVTS